MNPMGGVKMCVCLNIMFILPLSLSLYFMLHWFQSPPVKLALESMPAIFMCTLFLLLSWWDSKSHPAPHSHTSCHMSIHFQTPINSCVWVEGSKANPPGAKREASPTCRGESPTFARAYEKHFSFPFPPFQIEHYAIQSIFARISFQFHCTFSPFASLSVCECCHCVPQNSPPSSPNNNNFTIETPGLPFASNGEASNFWTCEWEEWKNMQQAPLVLLFHAFPPFTSFQY